MPDARASDPVLSPLAQARRARRRRRRARRVGALAALMVSNLGIQTVVALGSPPPESSPPLLRAAALPAPDFEPPPPPPTTAPAPAPAPAPAEADSVIGGIEIPRLGINVALHEGIELKYINRGPSHWPGTAMPGQAGNVVVAGHRTTRTKPFRHLDYLAVGDQVIFTMERSRWVYKVTGSEVVPDTALWITDQTAEPTATLFACHPPGSAKFRWVTRLALDEAASQPGPVEAGTLTS